MFSREIRTDQAARPLATRVDVRPVLARPRLRLRVLVASAMIAPVVGCQSEPPPGPVVPRTQRVERQVDEAPAIATAPEPFNEPMVVVPSPAQQPIIIYDPGLLTGENPSKTGKIEVSRYKTLKKWTFLKKGPDDTNGEALVLFHIKPSTGTAVTVTTSEINIQTNTVKKTGVGKGDSRIPLYYRTYKTKLSATETIDHHVDIPPPPSAKPLTGSAIDEVFVEVDRVKDSVPDQDRVFEVKIDGGASLGKYVWRKVKEGATKRNMLFPYDALEAAPTKP